MAAYEVTFIAIVEADSPEDAVEEAKANYIPRDDFEASSVTNLDEEPSVPSTPRRKPSRPTERVTVPLACPTHPSDVRDEDAAVTGCGSTDLVGPDREGLVDCCGCGIWFHPETEYGADWRQRFHVALK